MAGWVVCVLVGVSTATGQTEAVALATDFEPEAPAVYLEESYSWTIDKKRHHLEVRKRILLRSRDGFEHADHYFFYDADNSELVSFSARTVLPDGSHRPLPHRIPMEIDRREGWILRLQHDAPTRASESRTHAAPRGSSAAIRRAADRA
jgi:hypothetical protein